MTDIIHAAPFFERNRKGNNFCLKEIVYNGDKHLNKTNTWKKKKTKKDVWAVLLGVPDTIHACRKLLVCQQPQTPVWADISTFLDPSGQLTKAG